MTNLVEAMARAMWERPVAYGRKRVPFDALDVEDQDVFRAYARAALTAIEASGTHRVVPVEPTEAIADAFTFIGTTTFRERYAAMLAAAPKVTE